LTGGESPSYADIDELLAHMDAGLQMFEHLQHPPAPGATSTEDAPSEEFASLADAPAGTAVQQPLMAAPGTPMPSSQALQDVAADNAPVPAQPITVPLVRVRSDMLDRLLNHAGEVSISRSKIETEVSTLRHSLNDLTENMARLRSHLREMEIQAETQIASQMAQSADRDFDPLEFDRFTRLQELTRIMAENVNDVTSLQQNLARGVEGTLGDLGAQARLTRELQQDLMRVRMVQFAT